MKLLVTLLGSQKRWNQESFTVDFSGDDEDEFSVEVKEIKNQHQPTNQKMES